MSEVFQVEVCIHDNVKQINHKDQIISMMFSDLKTIMLRHQTFTKRAKYDYLLRQKNGVKDESRRLFEAD